MATKEKPYKINIPELLWHGGGNEHGKPDPVYSVDIHPTEPILLTSGIDANVPPKGSVRLWKISAEEEGQEFLVDLCDHQSVVNIARFSPCGRLLASASEKQILIYTLPANLSWQDITEVRQLGRMFVCPSLSEIYDLDWAPDSSHIVIGALEGKAEIVRVSQRDSVIVPGHTSYVQGVSWDPMNKIIATFSCDRSCKIHQLKTKEGQMTKLANRGHATIKMHNGFMQNVEIKAATGDSKEKDALEQQMEQVVKGINLFADSTVPSFFRRLSFSPDGSLLVIPTGIHRHLKPSSTPSSSSSSTSNNNRSFATHVFVRDFWQTPAVSLAGLEEPSVGVRFCPKPFQLLSSSLTSSPPMFQGSYRWLYAVITIGSIFVFDTQHPHPLFKVSGIHYAAINDVAWSADGRMLVVCSSDGYLTFVRFAEHALGEVLTEENVPEVVKRSHPALYAFTEPVTVPVATATVAVPKTVAITGDLKEEENMDVDETEASASPVKNNDAPYPFAITNHVNSAVTFTTPTVTTEEAIVLKKRKRIQPVQIAPPTRGGEGSNKQTSDNNSGGMDVDEQGMEESKQISPQAMKSTINIMELNETNDASEAPKITSGNINVIGTAQKKRIAPILVSVASSSSSSFSSVAATIDMKI